MPNGAANNPALTKVCYRWHGKKWRLREVRALAYNKENKQPMQSLIEQLSAMADNIESKLFIFAKTDRDAVGLHALQEKLLVDRQSLVCLTLLDTIKQLQRNNGKCASELQE